MAGRERQRYPRKGVPQGRAGVDRAPVRLWRTAWRFCPASAKWVGPGSNFDNPFRSPPGLARAAAIVARFPKREAWGVLGGVEPAPPTDAELAAGATWLYREWRAGRIGDLSKNLQFRLREAKLDALTPPTDEEVRVALRGFDLADLAPYHHASHVSELLRVANARAPDLFEEAKS